MAKKKKGSWLRRMLGLGALAGAAYAIWRAVEQNRADRDLGWTPQPFPFPPQPRDPSPPTDSAADDD
jgi:hypothetical protein